MAKTRSEQTGENNPNWRGGMARLLCNHCGCSYDRVPATASASKFCSKVCKDKAAATRSRACEVCGGLTPTRSSRFCSDACRHPNRKPRECPACGGATMKGRKFCSDECRRGGSVMEARRCKMCLSTFKVARSAKKKHCSKACSRAAQSMRQTGEKSHLWQGGLTNSALRVRGHKMYDEWRTSVFERDSYTCQSCLAAGGRLTAHHIVRFSDEPKLRLKKSNGVTLCWPCHCLFHANEHEIGIQETKLSKRVSAWLNKEPGVHFLNVIGSASQASGHPDFLGSVAGRSVGIELKIRPNFLSPIQRHVSGQWISAGMVYRVCYSLADVKSLINAIKESEND